jgi:tetratricopeptide (TPR) repeat protein
VQRSSEVTDKIILERLAGPSGGDLDPVVVCKEPTTLPAKKADGGALAYQGNLLRLLSSSDLKTVLSNVSATGSAAEAPQTRERRVELGASILTQRALAAYRDGRYVETLMALSERARIVPEQNDLLLIRGWSYVRLGRYNDAEKVFRAVQQTGYSEEAAAGLNAILEITGRMRY